MKCMGKYLVALFVDGPNMMRKEYEFGLDHFEKVAAEYGEIRLRRIYFNPQVRGHRPALVEAAYHHGFQPFLGFRDVDTIMTAHAVETILTRDEDLIALATSDADFVPVLHMANERGKDTLVLLSDNCSALQKAATYSRNMQEFVRQIRQPGT